jgi:hypothetical protein
MTSTKETQTTAAIRVQSNPEELAASEGVKSGSSINVVPASVKGESVVREELIPQKNKLID